MFQHTAARRRLVTLYLAIDFSLCVSTHSRPKAAGFFILTKSFFPSVSTHSRPKAAGDVGRQCTNTSAGFNTQPPEGGWLTFDSCSIDLSCFNTQPPEGGWLPTICTYGALLTVSTHSRPKAAGRQQSNVKSNCMFQHTAARRRLAIVCIISCKFFRFQHTAARRRLAGILRYHRQ